MFKPAQIRRALATFALLGLAAAAPTTAMQVAADQATATTAASAKATTPQAISLTRRTVIVQGQERAYYEYAPTNVADLREYDARGVKVLVSLHPEGQTAEQHAARTGWPALAEEKGFVVVFPEAANGSWNTNHLPALGNDIDFVVAMAAAVRTRFALTATIPTYLSGVGKGGSMVHEIAMRNPSVATAIAAIDGVAEPGTLALPPAEFPPSAMSVWQFASGRSAAVSASQVRQIEFWRRANAVNARNASTAPGMSSTTYFQANNPIQFVRLTTLAGVAGDSPEVSRMVWEQLFSRVVRFADSKLNNGSLHPDRTISDMGLLETTREIPEAGGQRRWLTYVPPQYAQLIAAGRKLPLVFSFHGRNGSARFQALISKWHEVAQDEGFIVVYPHGIGATWSNSMALNNPDVAFFQAVLAHTRKHYAIDDGRVFLNGSSMGTAFSNRLGVQFPQLFAGLALCYSGHLSAANYSHAIVRTDVPMPVWQCRGAQELASEFPGSESAGRTFWRETVNRHVGPPVVQQDGRRTTEIWTDGLAEYRWQVTEDLGHFWHPGQARKMWDEMLSKYRRGEDGSLIRLR